MADDQPTPRQDDPSLDPSMFSPRPMAGASPAMMPALPMEPQAGPDQSFIDRQVQGRKELTKETIAKLEPYQRQQFDIGMAGVRHPPQPRLRDIPKAPQDNFRNVFKESMPGLIFTTLLGSVMSKRHGMGAMAAATGYMEGFHSGDKERMDNERQKWRDNVDGLIAQNNVEIERSAAIWRDTGLSMQEKQGKLQALASAEGNALKIDALKRGDMDALYQFDKDRRISNERLQIAQIRSKFGILGGPQNDVVQPIAEGIITGKQPPVLTGLYGKSAAVRAELEKKGFNLSEAQVEWERAKKQISSLNGPQMTRFFGLAKSVDSTIDEVRNISKQMDLGGIGLLNKIELSGLMETRANTPHGQLAIRYINAVNTLKEEFANLAQGGYAPTEPVWKLANEQINGNYGVKGLGASLDEIQRLINYRVSAIPGYATVGPNAPNRYTGQQGQEPQQQPQSPQQASGGLTPSPAAVEHLRKNPNLAEQFDAKYGVGQAARLLGGLN